MKIFRQALAFEWDSGNRGKNFKEHKVTDQECEEVFFDPKKKILKDQLHSDREERFLLLGKTKMERLLFVAFTARGDKVRVISARDINKRERHLYEKKI